MDNTELCIGIAGVVIVLGVAIDLVVFLIREKGKIRDYIADKPQRLLWIFVALGCVFGGAAIIYQNNQGSKWLESYDKAFLSMCAASKSSLTFSRTDMLMNPPASNISYTITPNLPTINEQPKFLAIVRRQNSNAQWHQELGEQWRANNTDEVDFIICIDREPSNVNMGTCNYQGGSTATVRTQFYTLVVIDPKSGQIITEGALFGDTPDCAKTIRAGGGYISGSEPETYLLPKWLSKFVQDLEAAN